MGALLGGLIAAGIVLLLPDKSESPSGERWLQIARGFLGLLAAGGVLLGLAHWHQALRPCSASWSRRPSLRGKLLKLTVLLGATLGLSFGFHDIAFSHDHAVHCFKAFHFWNEMLGRARLMGWTHFLAFGFPSGELTPFGPELWVALFRAATFGLLSWPRTYALAFAGVVVFAVDALYLFGKRFFGRTVAIIAVIVWVLDPGGWYQGGWFWFEWLGVWPVTLAMSFTLLALVDLADLLSTDAAQPCHRPLLKAAFWMSASLVTHQLSIIVYGIALPCMLLAQWLRDVRLARAQVLRFVAAIGLGFGLAAFYLVPMFARSGLTQDLGVRGFSLADLAHRLVDMGLFENGWSPIVALGLLGGALALRGRTPSGLFFVASTATFVLLSSDILVSVFHAERWMKSILKIECQRMLLVAKLFWYPLAAYAAVTCFHRTAKRATDSPLRRLIVLVLLAALGSPLAVPALLHLYETRVKKTIEHRGATPLAQDLLSFSRWSRRERQASNEPYRIAYSLIERHDHIVAIAPVFDDTFAYKVGYTPAQQFRSFPMSEEPELLEALGVKYLVADHDYPAPVFIHERSFGQLRVYRFTRYRAYHPFTLIGAGQAELVRLEPETIHLRLRGTGPGTRLKLHVAGYPRWRATLDGREVAIAPATVHGMEYPILMEVPAAGGDLVFRYVRRTLDWYGLSVTLASLLIVGLVALGRHRALGRLDWRQATPPVAAKLLRVSVWGAGAALVVAGILVAVRRPPSPEPVLDRLAPSDELTLAGVRCEARGPGRWRCGGHTLGEEVVSGAYGSHLCWSTPSSGPLVITARKQLGRHLVESYDPSPGRAGRIRILVDGELLGETLTRDAEHGLVFLQADTRARAGSWAELRFELEGAPLHCFDLRILR